MSSISKRAWVAVAAALMVPLLAGSAVGDVVTRRDPKDTRGRLDIRRIAHGHAGDAVFHTVTMHRRFPSKLLRPGGTPGGALLLWLADDPSLESEAARVVFVRWNNGRLRAPVYSLWTDRRVGTARVTRPNRRTVRVVIPRSALGSLAEHPGYYWAAMSVYWDRGACRGEGCWDGAPNRRTVRHFIPEPAPEEPPEEVGS